MKILYTKFLLVAVLFAVSCKKDATIVPTPAPDTNSVKFAAILNGSNEIPANASKATGLGIATFDKVTKILSLSVIYSGVVATDMHIHKAKVNANGPVIFPLGTSPWKSPVMFNQRLSVGQEDSLMRSLLYINIHSAAFPGGEIRGQINR